MFADNFAARATAPSLGASPSLAALVETLVRIDWRSVSDRTVGEVLGAAPVDDADLAPFVNFGASRYTRNRIYRDERFEVLALCWSPHVQSPVHDHGGSRCFVRVARGVLEVDNFALLDGGREPGRAEVRLIARTRVRAGELDVRSRTRDIHRVSVQGEPAISLHVYAAPLERCLVFDLARETCRSVVNGDDRKAPN